MNILQLNVRKMCKVHKSTNLISDCLTICPSVWIIDIFDIFGPIVLKIRKIHESANLISDL